MQVGYDKFSYSYCDKDGFRSHQSLREAYGETFQEGDVVGVLIHLPDDGSPVQRAEKVKWKGQTWLLPPAKKVEAVPLPGSFLAFSRNGVAQGTAFEDLLKGVYFPAGSLFTLPDQERPAQIKFNFGACPRPAPLRPTLTREPLHSGAQGPSSRTAPGASRGRVCDPSRSWHQRPSRHPSRRPSRHPCQRPSRRLSRRPPQKQHSPRKPSRRPGKLSTDQRQRWPWHPGRPGRPDSGREACT